MALCEIDLEILRKEEFLKTVRKTKVSTREELARIFTTGNVEDTEKRKLTALGVWSCERLLLTPPHCQTKMPARAMLHLTLT